jgi:membrane-bound ClpP family serine protease
MDLLTLAYILVAIGLLLLASELFLPTHGILFGLGVSLALIGTALTFEYGLTTGLSTLVGLLIIVPILGSTVMYAWRKSPAGRRLILEGPDADAALASMPATIELEQLRGRYGRAVSALRPCGSVDFNGRRVDTMTDGAMVAPGDWVKCVDIRGGRVIVRQAKEPPKLEDMNFKDIERT